MMANSLRVAAGAAILFVMMERRLYYSEALALGLGLPLVWGPMTRLISELRDDREYFRLERRVRRGGWHFESHNARLAYEVLVRDRCQKKPASFWRMVYDWAFKRRT